MTDQAELLRAAAARGRSLASSSKLNLIYTDEETEFLKAMDHYKREHSRPNPNVTEILAVLKSLGYTKS